MKNNSFLRYGLIFLCVYLVLNLLMPSPPKETEATGDFSVHTTQKAYEQNHIVTVNIRNNTGNTVYIPNKCPAEPLAVLKKVNNEWVPITSNAEINCENTEKHAITSNNQRTIHYDTWAHALFSETGTYKIRADIEVPATSPEVSATTSTEPATTAEPTTAAVSSTATTVSIESNEFEIQPQGWLGSLWTYGFYQPVYNVLIYLASIVPGHDLGLAIILLTILLRTILLIPSQKAMKSQRKLQELQPKLNHLKEKHKDNQAALAQETMALWKEHKVNPLGSCLPLLIQLPVLIALFYVIQTGLNPNNEYLFYGFLEGFSLKQINVVFLGILDLTTINTIVLPLIVGGLQFAQMKLAMMRSEKKKEQGKEKNKDQAKKGAPEMEMANKMMLYFMPVMIALFTASVPAGVGLYWSVSTLYGIGQQIVVNRQVAEESSGKTKNGDVKVRVIHKK